MKNIIISICCLFSPILHGQDFDKAEELYERRGEGDTAIFSAITAFQKLLKEDLSLDDKIYVVERIAALYTYKAQLFHDNNIRKRIPYLNSCMKAADIISPARVGGEKLTEYYYWRGSCLALWAEANGVSASLRRTNEIINLCKSGRNMDPTYFGGGFDRVLGEMYARLPPLNPFGPAGSFRKSISHFKTAISLPAHENAMNPEYETGEYFYETHYLYIKTLFRYGQRSNAMRLAKDTLSKINRGNYNPDRKPEAMLAKDKILRLLSNKDSVSTQHSK